MTERHARTVAPAAGVAAARHRLRAGRGGRVPGRGLGVPLAEPLPGPAVPRLALRDQHRAGRAPPRAAAACAGVSPPGWSCSASSSLVAAFVGVFGALLVDQLGELIRSTPEVVRSVVSWVNDTFGTNFLSGDIVDALRLTPARIQELAQNFSPDLVGFVTTTIGVVFQGFTLLLFAFYMSAEGPKLRDVVSRRFPARQQRVIATVWTIAVEKTGGYVVSRLVLAALSTVVTAIFLLILGVPYWLPLAIWTGLVSQFIPTIGTYLAILLPALIALARAAAGRDLGGGLRRRSTSRSRTTSSPRTSRRGRCSSIPPSPSGR